MTRARGLAVLAVGLTLGGCAGREKRDAPAKAEPTLERRELDRKIPAKGDEPIKGEPGVAKVARTPASEPPANEPARTVSLPASVEVGGAPSLPAKALVAVAFVRRGQLVRRPEALRTLAHELGNDGVSAVVALTPLTDDYPDVLALVDLARAAHDQGAHLLVVDIRDEDASADPTTFVLHGGSRRVVAHVAPRGAAPTGSDLVARLVVASTRK